MAANIIITSFDFFYSSLRIHASKMHYSSSLILSLDIHSASDNVCIIHSRDTSNKYVFSARLNHFLLSTIDTIIHEIPPLPEKSSSSSLSFSSPVYPISPTHTHIHTHSILSRSRLCYFQRPARARDRLLARSRLICFRTQRLYTSRARSRAWKYIYV